MDGRCLLLLAVGALQVGAQPARATVLPPDPEPAFASAATGETDLTRESTEEFAIYFDVDADPAFADPAVQLVALRSPAVELPDPQFAELTPLVSGDVHAPARVVTVPEPSMLSLLMSGAASIAASCLLLRRHPESTKKNQVSHD